MEIDFEGCWMTAAHILGKAVGTKALAVNVGRFNKKFISRTTFNRPHLTPDELHEESASQPQLFSDWLLQNAELVDIHLPILSHAIFNHYRP